MTAFLGILLWGLKRHRPFGMLNPISHRDALPSLAFRRVSQPQLTPLGYLEPLAIPIQVPGDDLELLQVPQVDVGGDTHVGVDVVYVGIGKNVFNPAERVQTWHGGGCVGRMGRRVDVAGSALM
jgi:hypothetical protein